MTTTAYTNLETLLLFRGIAQYGFEPFSFTRIADDLRGNDLVKHASTYDAARLKPELLQQLFLNVLRDELEPDANSSTRLDGAHSPASKNRKLQLHDALLHPDKVESAYLKYQNAYIRQSINEVQELEKAFDRVQGEIRVIERAGEIEAAAARRNSPNGNQDFSVKPPNDTRFTNGTAPPASASPRLPPPPIGSPLPSPIPQQFTPRQDVRNGPSPAQQAARGTPPQTPAVVPQQAVRSPQLPQPGVQRPPIIKPQESPKPPNGVPQVLQPPQGVPSFQTPPQSSTPTNQPEGLQRPDGISRPKPPPSSQTPASSNPLKWEPPYQPNTPNSRPPAGPNQQPLSLPGLPPQGLQHMQRPPHQYAPHASPRPLQPQSLPSPQNTGHYPPHLQPAPARLPLDSSGGPSQNRQPLAPNPQQNRGVQQQLPFQHPQAYHQPYPSPVAARNTTAPPASPSTAAVPPRPSPGLAPPQQNLQPLQPPQPPQPPNQQVVPRYGQPGAPSISPSPGSIQQDAQKAYNSPYQQPRSAIPDRMQQQRLPPISTPGPSRRISPASSTPQTPVISFTARLALGSGTKWGTKSTPSTPKAGPDARATYFDMPSPAFEPLSPILQHAVLPPAAPKDEPKKAEAPTQPAKTISPKRKAGRPRASQPSQEATPPPPPAAPVNVDKTPRSPLKEAAPPAEESKGEAQPEPEPDSTKVKDEVTTPKPSTEAGDTTADESVASRRHHSTRNKNKRKREDLSPSPAEETPAAEDEHHSSPRPPSATQTPGKVMWTRSFNKVSGSAMEQIVHHRSANMFAAPIRERDAPGYTKVILQPQDLKSIRNAINHGNRAAAHAAAALPDGDPGTSSVWLPIGEELIPPKGIINSSQLDCELAHMFSNAIMYNPDPWHGTGPTFMREQEPKAGDLPDGGAHHPDGTLGYKVDEYAVVNDARAMYHEVDKLLTELRAAEDKRGGGNRPGGIGGGLATGTSTRQASVAGGHGGEGGGAGARDESVDMDVDEHWQPTETETVGSSVKRRRTARG